MENVYKVPNFLPPEELEEIDRILTDENLWSLRSEKKEDARLGRVIYTIEMPHRIKENIKQKVEKLLEKELPNINLMFAHYEAKYGHPNLAPHFDGDNNSVIIDYQYKSNTFWPLGLDTEVFEMNDNDALIFNPNQYPHWRPHKVFKEGEFVTMIFFRFPDQSGQINYSHLNLLENDPAFDKAKKVRDNLL
jgi:hypothetical protein